MNVMPAGVTPGPTNPSDGREWVVSINLTPNDTYSLHRTECTQLNRTVTSTGLPPQTSSSRVCLTQDYAIQKMCGDCGGQSDWSYMRFEVKNFSYEDPEDLLPGSNSGPGADESDTSLSSILVNVLPGHTFTAKLSHNGQVLRRDRTNIQSSVSREVSRALESQPEELRQALAPFMRATGMKLVEQVQEGVYPYLQCTPPKNQQVKVHDSWIRTSKAQLTDLQTRFTFRELITDITKLPLANSHDTHFATSPSPADHSFLVIDVSAHQALDDPQYIAGSLGDMFPKDVLSTLTFNEARASNNVSGVLIVGAQTGVVLDASTTLNSAIYLSISMPKPQSREQIIHLASLPPVTVTGRANGMQTRHASAQAADAVLDQIRMQSQMLASGSMALAKDDKIDINVLVQSKSDILAFGAVGTNSEH
jgi:hypothetical protein